MEEELKELIIYDLTLEETREIINMASYALEHDLKFLVK